ncbi:MAG: methionine synthase [Candidatus Omnitrophica bacterium]|nr:methionine synthase [Candidatus Omnitrophota bacterium]
MKFNFEATGIGSVPFRDPKAACDVIFDNFPSIPFWPQLSRLSYLENMYVQYSENIPGIVVDEIKKTVHVDTADIMGDIEKVYGKYLDGDVDFFGISEKYAAGFYEFLRRKAFLPKETKFVKGHITGPISYAMTLTNQNKESIFYNKDLVEVLTKVLAMKARWQIRQLKKLSPNVIIFLDEPYLISFGSGYVMMDQALASGILEEVAGAVKEEGALCGVHCCGNTDWSFLLQRGIDIINFDAYNFTKEFLLYAAELKGFFERGSAVAWGIVPSSNAVEKNSAEIITQALKAWMQILHTKGIEKGVVSSLITPSCGVGTLDEKSAQKVFETTRRVSELMQG